MNEVANYLEQVKVFQAVSPEEAKALMDAKDGGILFIGRESCPYCRRFVAKLSPLAQEAGLKVAYLHSQNPETLSQSMASANGTRFPLFRQGRGSR